MLCLTRENWANSIMCGDVMRTWRTHIGQINLDIKI